MGRAWTSQPPGMVSVRLNVSPETRLKLNELAGAAGVSMAQFTRRVVEAVCRSKMVSAQAVVEELRQEKLAQFAAPAKDSPKTTTKAKPSKRKK